MWFIVVAVTALLMGSTPDNTKEGENLGQFYMSEPTFKTQQDCLDYMPNAILDFAQSHPGQSFKITGSCKQNETPV